MNNDVIGIFEFVGGVIGEGASVVVLVNLLRMDVRSRVASSTKKIAFINHCSAQTRMVEGANGQETSSIVSRDMEVTPAFRDSIRTDSGR